MSTVRGRLEEIIARIGTKQAHLAKALGEDPTWLNRRVKGRVPIEADDLPRLAEALNVDVCDFYPEPEDMLLKIRRFERAGASLGGMTPEQFRATGYRLSIPMPKAKPERAKIGGLPEQPGMADAIAKELETDLADLPDPEREVARRMGALLIEYRDRILREERGEG